MKEGYVKKLFNVVAGLAWAGFAMSGAAPADAKMQTSQLGSYALCSNSSTTDVFVNCNGSFSYHQNLKLLNTSCNQGDCGPADWWPNVEMLYGTGRKTAERLSSCNSWNLFALGSCAC